MNFVTKKFEIGLFLFIFARKNMKFLIQTFDGEIKHDFSFGLINAIDYHNWLNPESMEYWKSDEEYMTGFTRGYIPIGSVEFVSGYFKQHFGFEPKPINIPVELMSFPFTQRFVFNGTEKDIIGTKFVKSNDKIKSFTEVCDSAPIGNYQISDIIDIESEYRCFVYKNELVGISYYSGDFRIFPNIQTIEDMILAYKNSPIAYTLDVAISNGKTVVVELHNLFSVGLYGFANYQILPFMFSQAFHELVKINSKIDVTYKK